MTSGTPRAWVPLTMGEPPHPPGDPGSLESSFVLGRILEERRDEIVSAFVAEVQRKDLPPVGLAHSLLVDHIPAFIDEIVGELARKVQVRTSLDALDTSATARRHGGQRWGIGYDLEALIREYGILRHCILTKVKEANVQLTVDEFDVLAKCLSVGVADAATEYVKYRDRQLGAQRENLEFLAKAGELLTSSLDYRSTLSRLTELIVPRMADWCAVRLDEKADGTHLAHVDPAKLDILRDLYERFPVPSGKDLGYAHVVRTGEPQLVAEVDFTSLEAELGNPEHAALLRVVGTTSWLVVPLKVQGHVLGTITFAYGESGRQYAEQDLVLANELARRAAVAIDNARLYELSQQERSRVEAATRAKDEFVAIVSHELRTPLQAILGWLSLMRTSTLSEEKREHAFDVIERNAMAQSQLVADLLDISRVITGKIRINPAHVELSNVVEMAIEGVRPAAEAKRIVLDAEIDRENAVMRGDGDRLQQVVWNLLANAVKFTPKGGRIKVRLRRVDSDFELVVDDTGTGIAPEFLPHLFESFRQFESGAGRAHGGLGIGLAIAKHIVELHGGSIEARSAGTGRGAMFVVRLPVSPLVTPAMVTARVPATMPRTATPIPIGGADGIRVLVVDDESDARDLVAYVLESRGMEVRSAGSAAEALRELEAYTPHVIVSDIGMPEEDGFFFIRNVRTLPADDKKNIPAIALTAFARNEDRTRALVEGFNLHMAKPVEPAALAKAVVDLAGPAPKSAPSPS